jgi:FkbM family methyltransferase
MLGAARKLIARSLKKLDIAVIRSSRLQRLEYLSGAGDRIELLLQASDAEAARLLKALRISKSQLRQDLFVLLQLHLKQNGFFVEFGSTNGIDFSNTYVLEKEFGWSGILAEPAKCWHQALRQNRNCHIETDCVWRDSNSSLRFNESNLAELSTISTYRSSDFHSQVRGAVREYDVKTISLLDLLEKFHAPKTIDYLSIDTEGSEYEILKDFDFGRYQFRVITCEHNFSKQREKLFNLLTRNGYRRTCEKYSAFDDWYVKIEPA